MTIDPLTTVAACEANASLVIEVERTDGEPLSAPVTVKLSGTAAKALPTSGDPARAVFSPLDPGHYEIALELAGDEASYEIMNTEPLQVDLAAAQQAALRIDIEGEDAWEVVQADTSHEDIEDEATPDDEEEDDEDDWEMTDADVPDDDAHADEAASEE